MTSREKVFSVAAILAIALATFFVREWSHERSARLKAQTVQAAQQVVIAGEQKKIADAQADAQQTAAQLRRKLAFIEAEKRRPVTAEQFVASLDQVIPNLPQIPKVTVESPAKVGQLPAAPVNDVVIPAADLPALQAYKLDCDATGLKLSACTKTSADLKDQLAGTKAQLAAQAKEAKAWKTAAKGGSVWHRLGRGLKCAVIQSAAAYGGAEVDKSNPGVGAALGTAAGDLGCSLF